MITTDRLKKSWCFLIFLAAILGAQSGIGGEAVFSDAELDAQTVKLWNTQTGELLVALSGHKSTVNAVVYSPDGKTLATAGADKTIKLWDVTTNSELATLDGHNESVTAVAFSPDGKVLASASADSTIRLWDAKNQKLLRLLSGHSDAVTVIAFSPDGNMIASGSHDRTIRLWPIFANQQARTISGSSREITALDFGPHGKTLASANADQEVKFWNVTTGEEIGSSATEKFGGDNFAYSPDKKTLAIAGRDNLIRLIDLATGRSRAVLRGHASVVSSISFSADSKTLLSGSWDSTARVWDVSSAKQLHELKGNSFRVTSVAFSPDGKTCVSSNVLASVVKSPGLYILAIGVNDYAGYLKQSYAVADAREFADAIERVGKRVFERIDKQVLLDEQVSRASVEAAFNRIVAEARPQDVFVFHFAGIDGHAAGEFYLLPPGFSLKTATDRAMLDERAVSATFLKANFTRIMARKQLIILDTCSSSKAFETFVSQVSDETSRLSEGTSVTRHHAPAKIKAVLSPALRRSMMILTVAGTTYEDPRLKHGLLTYALLQGLKGEAVDMQEMLGADLTDTELRHHYRFSTKNSVKPKEGLITAGLLEAYAYSKVKVLSQQLGFPRIVIQAYAAGDDFEVGYTPRKSSTSLRADIVWSGTKKRKAAVERQGKDYALLFATSNYDDPAWSFLPNPVRDARALKQTLEEIYDFRVELYEDKTADEINSILERYMDREFGPEDQLFIFFAGHGTYDEVKGGFVVAKDSKSRAADPRYSTFIRHTDIYLQTDKIKCDRILVTLDVCFGGAFGNTVRSGGGESAEYQRAAKAERIQRVMGKRCRKWLTSGGLEYVSDGSGNHSPFAYWLLDALVNGGDDGIVWFEDILKSVQQVSADQQPRWGDFPTNVPGSNFIFIAKSEQARAS